MFLCENDNIILVSSFVLHGGDESNMIHNNNHCRRIRAGTAATFCNNRLDVRRKQAASTIRTTATRNSALYMGMKVNIRIVGRKSSEPWLEDGVEMYETRLQPSNLEIETTWHKDNVALMKGVTVDQNKNHKVICLDPTGQHMTSEQFCDNLYNWLEDGGSRLSFIIGGAEGLPPELKFPVYSGNTKQSPPPLISLSDLTFTHQFARLLLIEQIYRATEIRKVRLQIKQKEQVVHSLNGILRCLNFRASIGIWISQIKMVDTIWVLVGRLVVSPVGRAI